MFGVLWQCVFFCFFGVHVFVFEVCENVCFVYCVYYSVCSVSMHHMQLSMQCVYIICNSVCSVFMYHT